jgi:two-component system chemotaxis response regulator CheY
MRTQAASDRFGEGARLLGGRRPRALVAEDDCDMRGLVAAALTRAGYDVSQASDGVELISELQSTLWNDGADPYRVVVADIHMPGLTGLDVIAALPDALRHTPVILMSAYATQATKVEARSLGAFAVLEKPFSIEDLHDLLRQLPEQR